MFLVLRRAVLCLFATVTFLSTSTGLASSTFAKDFEIWLVDQSNSTGTTFGGRIYIYDGDDLNGEAAAPATPTDVLDLSAATAASCLANTGANPVRPHMLQFNSSHSHAVLTFVASGHVVIFNAATREPVACVRMSAGAGGARQAHAASPAPDDSYILVANQNGKLLERINANFATDTFTLDSLATINLATCTTPNGLACEDASLRPDNAPIVPVVGSSSTLGFITFRGGDPHASTGSTPGLGVIQVTHGGKAGFLKSVIPIHNIDAAGIERADAHGIRVRLK